MRRGIVPIVVVVVVWWGVHELWNPPPTRLVGPAAVVGEFAILIRDGSLPAYVSLSLGRLALGLGLGAAIGIPAGWLLGLDRDIARAAEPLLRFLNAIAGITWVPMAIAWFGFTSQAILSVIVYTVVFPMVFNTMTAVQNVPSVLVEAARSLGATRGAVLRYVYVPGAFPGMMTGLRAATAYGWRALIAGEFIIGGGGLGFLIFDARTTGMIGRVMLGMVVLAALSLVVDRLILKSLEDHVSRRWGLVG